MATGSVQRRCASQRGVDVVTAPVVIVGGGMAGSLVAVQLLRTTTRPVIVVEPGGVDSDVRQCSRFLDNERHLVVDSSGRQQMWSAECLGGGAAANAMLATGDVPNELREFIRVIDTTEVGEVGSRLLLHGGQPAALWWTGRRSHPALDIFEWIDSGRLTVMRGRAESLIFDSSHREVRGVKGSFGEIDAACVVLASGALVTPQILSESGCASHLEGIGEGILNHPTVVFDVELSAGPAPRFDVSATRQWRTRNGHEVLVLAYERALHGGNIGQVAALLLDARSQGCIVGADRRRVYEPNVLGDPGDAVAMREVVRFAASVACAEVPLADVELDAWIAERVGLASHPVSGCHRLVDHRGHLRGHGGVWLADASVLPAIPLATPSIAVTMEAMRISAHLTEVFG